MIENEWTYYVNTNERIAKIIPIEDQVPGNNANNTEFTLRTTQISFYETDHLGNTRIVFSPEKFNADGSVDRKIHFAADYYPYGKTLRYFETSTFEEKYLTTQHERDRETGFDYRGARYYDNDLGRFLSLDPLASKFPAWSPYNYVMGNSISLIDPDGRAPQTKFVNNKGDVLIDIDDGSDATFVIEEDKMVELFVQIEKNFESGNLFSSDANEKLGKTFGKNINEIRYKPTGDKIYDLYSRQGYDCGYANDCLSVNPSMVFNRSTGNSELGVAYNMQKGFGMNDKEKGLMHRYNPKLSNKTPFVVISPNNRDMLGVAVAIDGRQQFSGGVAFKSGSLRNTIEKKFNK